MGAPGATPMSLSRRFLSLPEELLGSSLPPKVSGPQLGFVTLCIAHILESAVSSLPLPRVSLIRARWWGEEQPGSLFRPILLTGDGMTHVEETELSPHRAIRMKYPVCVSPEKLLEYFQDMKELTLDVIDRVTRKKYGKCILDLIMESGNSVMTAEEKLVALQHENVLCEIRASESGEESDVLGYLAVNFNVQWDNAEIYKWRGSATDNEMPAVIRTHSELNADGQFPEHATLSTTSIVDGNSEDGESGGTEAASRQVQQTRTNGARVATSDLTASTLVPFSSLMINITDSVVSPIETEDIVGGVNKKQTQEIGPSRESSADYQRIHRLLVKGKALKRSMEEAVQEKEEKEEKELVNSYAFDVIVEDTIPEPAKVVESFAWKDVEEARSIDRNENFEENWNENSQLLSSSSSSSFQDTQHDLPQMYATDKTIFASTKPVYHPRNVHANIRHEPVLKHQSTEIRDGRLLQFAVMFDSVSTSRNVEWYDGNTNSQIKGKFSLTDELQRGDNVEPSHVALHYVVPPLLTRVYPTDDKFERTIKRKLKGSRWLDNAPWLWADFTGNIHVFETSSSENASDHFSSGYLIIETWLYASKGTDRTLLGLSKLPLRKFSKFLRNGSPEFLLRGYSEQVLPFVGVEGTFAIENPFTGHRTGFLRVRVCAGTAEQLLALATTIKAIIKLQGVVRGVLYRKRYIDYQLDTSAQATPRFEPDHELKNVLVQTEASLEEKSIVDVGCDAMENVDNCCEHHEQVDDSTQTPPRFETDHEHKSVLVQTETSFEKVFVDVGCDAIENVDNCCGHHEQLENSTQTPPHFQEQKSVLVQTEASFEEKSVVDVGCDAMENVDNCCEHHEQVDDSTQTPPRFETDHEHKSVLVQTETSFEKVFVDVGCDAIENVNDCCKHQLDNSTQTLPHFETAPERKSELVTTEESKLSNDAANIISSLLEKVIAVVPKLSEQQTTLSDVRNPESSHLQLQNEKLELVYEMLREMHNAYFIKLAAKSVSIGEAKDTQRPREEYQQPIAHGKLVVYDNKDTSGQGYSCPNSPISSSRHVQKIYHDENTGSHNPAEASSPTQSVAQTSKIVDVKRCSCLNSPISRYPSLHNVQSISRDEDTGSATRPNSAYKVDDKSMKTSSQPQSVGVYMESKTSVYDGCIPKSKYTLAREIGARKSYRETSNIRRLPSANTCASKSRYSKVTAKEEHLSVQSLFAHDSETERIARIMQGSVNYWMKGDSSSSSDDEASDEEETSDDNCYF